MSFEKNLKSNKVAAYFPNTLTEDQFEMIDGMVGISDMDNFVEAITQLLDSSYEDMTEYGSPEDIVSFLCSKLIKVVVAEKFV